MSHSLLFFVTTSSINIPIQKYFVRLLLITLQHYNAFTYNSPMQNDSTLKLCTHMNALVKKQVAFYLSKTFDSKRCTLCSQLKSLCLCLHCGNLLCSHFSQNQCISKHQQSHPQHILTLSINMFIVFCNKCGDDLESMILAFTGNENSNQYLKIVRFISFLREGWVKVSVQFGGKRQKEVSQYPSFRNLGNTCFLNVVLQLLYATCEFVKAYRMIQFQIGKKKPYRLVPKQTEYFYDQVLQKAQSEIWHVVKSDKPLLKDRNGWDNSTKTSAFGIKTCQLNILIRSMILQLDLQLPQPYAPQLILSKLISLQKRYANNQQQDADELLLLMIDVLSQGETKGISNDEERYKRVERALGRQKLFPIQNIFGSYLASRLVCRQCHKHSWTLDLTYQISVQTKSTKLTNSTTQSQKQNNSQAKLEIPSAQPLRYPPADSQPLHSLLTPFFSQQILTKDKNYYNCSNCKSLTASKRLFLVNPPKILLVSIKRFTHGSVDNKNGTKNTEYVQFPQQMNLGSVCLNQGKFCYELYAVIVHEGKSMHSGHYVAYIGGQKDWICCSDQKVRRVLWREVKCQQAYILAYRLTQHKEY